MTDLEGLELIEHTKILGRDMKAWPRAMQNTMHFLHEEDQSWYPSTILKYVKSGAVHKYTRPNGSRRVFRASRNRNDLGMYDLIYLPELEALALLQLPNKHFTIPLLW